ncbi:hypothetical protein PAMP_001378 [Pampus punctatissimus]
MSVMYRSHALKNQELMALYGGEGEHCYMSDEDCTSEECDLDSEYSKEGKGVRGVRSSLSLEICSLQKEQQVYFSNQEYYRRLEELKSAHLRNMAELERMYISQVRERHDQEEERGRNREARESISGPARILQRINSQEELDFHETSSGSDKSELCGEESMGELELDHPRETFGRSRTFGRDIPLSLEDMMTQKQFRLQPKASCLKPLGRLSRQTGIRGRSKSKVTVPKPFQMMLREEERKRHKVRTRSEIELENTLLRRELEELQECQKKFRASPAPAHIHLPLYEIISRRSVQRTNRSSNNSNRDTKSASPFHFLERERRKMEAKAVTELGRLGPKEERHAFKARPMPNSVYDTRHRADTKTTTRRPQFLTICTMEREATEGQSDPSSDPEADTSPDYCKSQRCLSSKPVKRQIELSIEMVKERSYIDTLKATACNIRSPVQPGGQRVTNRSDYISV